MNCSRVKWIHNFDWLITKMNKNWINSIKHHIIYLGFPPTLIYLVCIQVSLRSWFNWCVSRFPYDLDLPDVYPGFPLTLIYLMWSVSRFPSDLDLPDVKCIQVYLRPWFTCCDMYPGLPPALIYLMCSVSRFASDLDLPGVTYIQVWLRPFLTRPRLGFFVLPPKTISA